jgi:hypothetical protein
VKRSYKLSDRQRKAIQHATFAPVFSAQVIIEAGRHKGRSPEKILEELEHRFDSFHSPHEILMELERKSGLKISYAPGRPGHADPCNCVKCRAKP